MQITEALTGRTIDYVTREENGDITLCCTCGHQVRLTARGGEVTLDRVNVKFVLPSLGILGGQQRI